MAVLVSRRMPLHTRAGEPSLATPVPIARPIAAHTKLTAPEVPVGYVERPRLSAALDGAVCRPLVLVSALAGAGRSSLLAAWSARATERHVAWVRVDDHDNASDRFWSAVVDAVDAAVVRAGGTPPARAGREPLRSDPVGTVVGRVTALDRPLVMILDDLHEVHDTRVLHELQTLVALAPPELRLVVSSRTTPALRLPRLRLQGSLAELRDGDLALNDAESHEVLTRLGLRVAREDLDVLMRRTGGWMTGVRLAALALAGATSLSEAVRRFGGDDVRVTEYLLGEVLSEQSAAHREFLLQTCLPDVLTPTLARDLSRRADAARVLDELHARNLLRRCPGEEAAYRYPPLLLEFLRSQLELLDGARVRSLWSRSSRSHWRDGETSVAFVEAIRAEDWDLAERIADEGWHDLLAGNGVHDRPVIPAAAVARRPALGLALAAVDLRRGDLAAARRQLELGEQSLQDAPAADPRPARALWALVKTTSLYLDGSFAALQRHVASSRSQFADGVPGNVRRNVVWQAMMQAGAAHAQLGLGRVEAGTAALAAAAAAAGESGVEIVELDCCGTLALVAAARGDLRRAAELARDADDLAERHGLAARPQAVPGLVALAWVQYLWDDLAACEQAVALAGEVAAGAHPLRPAIDALAAAVGAARGDDDLDGLLRRLHGNGRVADRPPRLHALIVPLVVAAEARLLLAGDRPEAVDAALRRWTIAVGEVPATQLVRARVDVAGGQPLRALATLRELRAGAGGAPTVAERIEADTLEAVARRALHHEAAALSALERAVALGAVDRFRRPIVDGGPAVHELLRRLLRRERTHYGYVAELVAVCESRADPVVPADRGSTAILTDRELAILRFLPTMMTNRDIAAELFLSVNTVKTHVRSIYRKLEATRRREAVQRARRVGLL